MFAQVRICACDNDLCTSDVWEPMGWREFLELARESVGRIEALTFQIESGGEDRKASGVSVSGGGTSNPTESEALRRMLLMPRLEERRDFHIDRVGKALAGIQSVRDGLGETEGEILEMFYIDGFLSGEIAGELDLTVDGVFYRKRKALKWMDENLPMPE